MKKIILSSAIACIAAFAFSASAMAEDVMITHQRSYDTYDHPEHVHPAITIDKHGVSVGAVQDENRCVTKTITKENEYGDRVTKTIRHCD